MRALGFSGYVALTISAMALVWLILSLAGGSSNPEMFAIGQNAALLAIAAFLAVRHRAGSAPPR
ncbi:MAG: hypothetical protein ACRENP_08475 [Longimicrobiales bacterium]